MITLDPSKRITAQQALSHDWIKFLGGEGTIEQGEPTMNAEVVNNLKNYRGESILKKAAMNILVKSLDIKEVRLLKKEFQKIDTDHSGFLEINELEDAIDKAPIKLTSKEIKDIVK